MQRFSLSALAVLALASTLAAPAQAFDPCFDWVCYKATKQCVFNATCSEDNGFNAKDYEWYWGDGGFFDAGDQPLAGHVYASGTGAYVTLDVGYEFISFYDVTCFVQYGTIVGGDPSTQWSGRCE